MAPSERDTAHLRALVFEHKVVFEVRPAFVVNDGQRVQIIASLRSLGAQEGTWNELRARVFEHEHPIATY